MISEKEVKQWLLARRLGIDRKTISRWVSGRTQRISKDNLTKLCDILEIGESEIIVGSRLEALGTREDRWEAARKLHEDDLIEIVGPTGNWELAESLVKSTIDPEMPAGLLSKLYLLLARVYHYLRRGEDFRRCSEISMRYAEQVSDELMYHQARLCLGTSFLMEAKLRECTKHYTACLETPELFTGKAIAATYSNLSSAYHQLAEFQLALEYSDNALKAWAKVKPNMSHATAYYLRAQVAIELSMAKEAKEAITRCRRMAEQIRYHRIGNLCHAMQADLLSMQERHREALKVVDESLELLPGTPRVSRITLEYLARALRRAGEPERAGQVLWETPVDHQPYGFEAASSELESARLHLALGDEPSARNCVAQANRLFTEIGATARLTSDLPTEHYRQG